MSASEWVGFAFLSITILLQAFRIRTLERAMRALGEDPDGNGPLKT